MRPQSNQGQPVSVATKLRLLEKLKLKTEVEKYHIHADGKHCQLKKYANLLQYAQIIISYL